MPRIICRKKMIWESCGGPASLIDYNGLRANHKGENQKGIEDVFRLCRLTGLQRVHTMHGVRTLHVSTQRPLQCLEPSKHKSVSPLVLAAHICY
jgi:hypothetical protein